MHTPVMPAAVAPTVPMVARRMVIELAVMADGRLDRAALSGQHEGHEEDDDGATQCGANELTWVGGRVLPRRF